MSLAQGVILDSSGKRAGRGRALQILVPRGHEDVIVGRCLVPGCGAKFYEGEEQAWQAHVGPCAREHLDRIKAVTRSLPIFDDYDPEVTAHLRRVGERMLQEGRLEVKPSEAAGFS